MSRPIVRIHNIETDEVIDREMTVAEFNQHKANLILDAEHQTEVDAKSAQKEAILDRLGVTADELKTILG